MHQISAKDKLSGREISELSERFNTGRVEHAELVEDGNINSNYILTTMSGKFVLRLYMFKTIKEAESELELLKYLSQKSFPCPIPKGGIEEVNGKPAACFEFIEGDVLSQCGDDDLFNAGKLLARLHILTENYKPIYQREGEGVSVIKYYLKNKKDEILGSRFRDSLKFVEFLNRELDKFSFSTDLACGGVHADMKPENMIRGRDGRLSLIDFDNWYIDAFVVDVGSTIMWLCTQDEKISAEKMNLFVTAYERERLLSKSEKNKIKDAVLYNCLKQAFKYAYICLPKLEFAEDNGYYFINLYKNIRNQELLNY